MATIDIMENQMNSTRPIIYAYIDYRKFLADSYKARADRDKKFTKSYICTRIGLPNSRSYFANILSGAKNISNVKMELLIKVFELDEDEAQFFRFLVQYNQTVVPEEREFFFDQLISLNKTPKQFVDKDAYQFYKDWHHSVIRAMLDIYDIGNDSASLAKKIRPALSVKKVRDSIALMDKLGLIKKNRAGFWKPVEKIIAAGDGVQEEMLKVYQADCLELGRTALLSKNSQQEITTKTISISQAGLKKIQRKLNKFKSEVSSIIHKDEDPAEGVYQLNIQFFPQSEVNKDSQ